MPPKKGENGKKESGRAKKAENEAKKAAAAAEEAERKEAAQWDDGPKKKKDKDAEREAKKAADAARKAENARILAEEEAAASSSKPKAAAPRKKSAKDKKPAGPGAIAAGGGLGEVDPAPDGEVKADAPPEEPETFSATGLDDALEMMSLVTAKTDKASVGQAAAGIESHPERRFKAAFEAYKERELPQLKVDRPGLRLNQYQELLYKQFQKSPENPFNQATISYNARQEDRVDALTRQKDRESNRYRVASP